MDFYLDDKNVYKRLQDRYKKYGNLIVAYDFDDTVYNLYQDDKSFGMVIDLIRRCKKCSTLIVFTARDIRNRNDYNTVVKYLNENNIPYDYINSDFNGIVPFGRKIYYNILLDDKAGLSSAYNVLNMVVNDIEKGIIKYER